MILFLFIPFRLYKLLLWLLVGKSIYKYMYDDREGGYARELPQNINNFIEQNNPPGGSINNNTERTNNLPEIV
jgi:hypothetical protein